MAHEKLQMCVKTVVDLPGGCSVDLDCITKSRNEQVVGLLIQRPQAAVSGRLSLVQMKKDSKGLFPLRGGGDFRTPQNNL